MEDNQISSHSNHQQTSQEQQNVKKKNITITKLNKLSETRQSFDELQSNLPKTMIHSGRKKNDDLIEANLSTNRSREDTMSLKAEKIMHKQNLQQHQSLTEASQNKDQQQYIQNLDNQQLPNSHRGQFYTEVSPTNQSMLKTSPLITEDNQDLLDKSSDYVEVNIGSSHNQNPQRQDNLKGTHESQSSQIRQKSGEQLILESSSSEIKADQINMQSQGMLQYEKSSQNSFKAKQDQQIAKQNTHNFTQFEIGGKNFKLNNKNQQILNSPYLQGIPSNQLTSPQIKQGQQKKPQLNNISQKQDLKQKNLQQVKQLQSYQDSPQHKKQTKQSPLKINPKEPQTIINSSQQQIQSQQYSQNASSNKQNKNILSGNFNKIQINKLNYNEDEFYLSSFENLSSIPSSQHLTLQRNPSNSKQQAVAASRYSRKTNKKQKRDQLSHISNKNISETNEFSNSNSNSPEIEIKQPGNKNKWAKINRNGNISKVGSSMSQSPSNHNKERNNNNNNDLEDVIVSQKQSARNYKDELYIKKVDNRDLIASKALQHIHNKKINKGIDDPSEKEEKQNLDVYSPSINIRNKGVLKQSKQILEQIQQNRKRNPNTQSYEFSKVQNRDKSKGNKYAMMHHDLNKSAIIERSQDQYLKTSPNEPSYHHTSVNESQIQNQSYSYNPQHLDQIFASLAHPISVGPRSFLRQHHKSVSKDFADQLHHQPSSKYVTSKLPQDASSNSPKSSQVNSQSLVRGKYRLAKGDFEYSQEIQNSQQSPGRSNAYHPAQSVNLSYKRKLKELKYSDIRPDRSSARPTLNKKAAPFSKEKRPELFKINRTSPGPVYDISSYQGVSRENRGPKIVKPKQVEKLEEIRNKEFITPAPGGYSVMRQFDVPNSFSKAMKATGEPFASEVHDIWDQSPRQNTQNKSPRVGFKHNNYRDKYYRCGWKMPLEPRPDIFKQQLKRSSEIPGPGHYEVTDKRKQVQQGLVFSKSERAEVVRGKKNHDMMAIQEGFKIFDKTSSHWKEDQN